MYKYLLAFRYLTTRYIGLVSIGSVMLGVMTLIVVNSVMWGFRAKMRERLHGILADIVVDSTHSDGFEDPEGVMELIRGVVGDKVVAMTPAIEIFAMLHYQNQGRGRHYSRPVRLVGVDPKGRAEVGDFREHLLSTENRKDPSFSLRGEALADWQLANKEKESPDATVPPGAIVGYQLATFRGPGMVADQYLIEPGQEVLITTMTAGRPKPVDDRMVVVDLFKSEMSEYDSQYVFMPIERLQEIRAMGNAVTSIQVKLRDFADASAVVRALQAELHPAFFQVQTWEEKQGPLLQAVKVEAFLLNFILFFIIAVAGFGILAVFFMIVVEKTRDIGILKALGASSRGIMGIFLLYGLSLGTVGCGLGALLGILIAAYINPIERTLAAWTGRELFPRDIYYFKDIPVLLDGWTILFVVTGALAIAVSASVLPARRAARLHPVEALRHE